jgi:hypothetical protein
MPKKFTASCLAGMSLLLCNSAPASIKANLPAAVFIQAPAAAADRPAVAMLEPDGEPLSSATDLAPLKGPLPDDSAIEESKDPGVPTSLERARAALAESNAPALSRQEICTRIAAVAQANELPIGFFANLIWRESQFDHEAISRVGAMGIAQFMPDVADRLGLDAFDARDALPASGRHRHRTTGRAMAGGQGKNGCLQCSATGPMPPHRRVRRNRAGGTRSATAQDRRGTEGCRSGARVVAAPEKKQGTQDRHCKPQSIELSCFFRFAKPRTNRGTWRPPTAR